MEEKRSMDKNQILGFIIIGVLLIGFSWWNSTLVEDPIVEPANTEQTTDTIDELNAGSAEESTTESTTDNNAAAELTPPAKVETTDSAQAVLAAETYKIENDLLEIVVKGGGAQMQLVRLKDFQTWDSLPLNIVDQNTLQNFSIANDINTKNLVFSGNITTTDTTQTLYLTAPVGDGEVTLWYKLYNGSYQLDAGIEGKNLGIDGGSPLALHYAQDAFRTEKSRKNELRITTVYYWESDDQDYDYLSLTGSDDEEELVNVKWVAHKQQFFTTIIMAGNGFKQAKVGQAELEDEAYTKRMASALVFSDKVGSNFSADYNLYYGPNDFNILKDLGNNYDKIIDFGWGIFGWIGRFVVIPIFGWLMGYGINFGIIILIMALMIKIVLFPLTYQSYKSMAKMRVLKPEIDELNEKHKNSDSVVKQQATMALYKEAGVNPLGGCIPQLVQLPILIAMFRFFPASIELRQKSFLWATDLSTYDDPITWSQHIPLLSDWLGNHLSIFTLLMAISTLMYTMMNQQMTASNSQMPQMKYIMYAMPVMMFFWFNSYASGLSYYYLLANLITFAQQAIIRKTVDDDKLHAKLLDNKKNPKKKSKFKQQLEDMAQKQNRSAKRQIK